jgi:5-methylthioadenosine/S-adenosylhomocysteine deaminase
MSTILIENATILTQNDRRKMIPNGYVLVENDIIAEVGIGESSSRLRSPDTRIDARWMVLIPGMVNAHTHLFQTFIRGLADDKPLLEWLKTAIWPVAQALTEEEARIAALLGLIENIRGGATAVIDHQYIHTRTGNDDAICRAAEEVGIRFMLARGWADQDYHPAFMETPERILAETTRLREHWQAGESSRIQVEFGPLIPWGCSDATMRATHALSEAWGSGMHIHVAETHTEVEMNLRSRGNRHIEWLAALNVLGPRTQLVHGVWLDDHELDLIASHGALVVHCPVSNMYLASGVARVPEMVRRGIPVALASDGPGSNNAQNMLETLKATALLHKVHTLDAAVFLPEDILWMACRGGARAFGLSDQIGSIEPGKKADLVLVDLDTPLAMPVHRPASALVYNAGPRDVDTVIVDGIILMRGKQILCLDERALLAYARESCAGLFRRAGIV